MEPEDVITRDDFVRCLQQQARCEAPAEQDCSRTIPELFEAMAAWLTDAPIAPHLQDLVGRELAGQPTWRGLAILVAAARVYE